LPHWPYALQIRQNRGCNKLPSTAFRARPTLLQIIAMPCLCALGPPLFCRISAEAVLLTVLFIATPIFLSYAKSKAGKGTSEKRAGSMACGRKLFSDLMFGYFASKVK
jgi:hypothetical protein